MAKRQKRQRGGNVQSEFERVYGAAIHAASACECAPCRTLWRRNSTGRTANNKAAPLPVRRSMLKRWRCEVTPIESEFTQPKPVRAKRTASAPATPREFTPARQVTDPRPALDEAIALARFHASTATALREEMRVPDDWLLSALRKALYTRANGEVVLPHGAIGAIARRNGEPHHRVRLLAKRHGLRIGYGERREFALELMMDAADETGVMPRGTLAQVAHATGMGIVALRGFLNVLRTRDGIALWSQKGKPGTMYRRALPMLRAAADPNGYCPRGTFARIARAVGAERHGLRKFANDNGFYVFGPQEVKP